jgi:drug/metabolite transporter (DMT)-like permease
MDSILTCMFNVRLLLVAVIWGINFSVVKFALTDFLPLSFTVLRFILAALFLFFVMTLYRESLSVDRQDRAALVKLGLVGITAYNLLFMYGLKYTSASNSALLISLSPLFAVLILALSGKERMTARIIIGLGLASAGVFLIINSRYGGFRFEPSDIIGDLLTLGASLFWALYALMAKPLLEKYSPVKVTAYSIAAGSILLLPLSVHDLVRQPWAVISAHSWLALGFSAFIAAGVAFTLWYQGIKQIGITRTIVYHYLMPCVAVIFAALFLGESITFLLVLGGILILIGVLIVQRRREP